MDFSPVAINELTIIPRSIDMYLPPMVWKGDCIGHIGARDTFFWVLEGECFLTIDSQCFIVRPGQLAYLPKGKRRAYTQTSPSFIMYEMGFEASVRGKNLMDMLGFMQSDYVVTIPQKEELSQLFENSAHVEMYRDPIYDMAWCANIINIIRLYAQARSKQNNDASRLFAPVLQYMTDHLDQTVTTEELAALVYMQPTYFTRRFKAIYGLPPIAYLGHLRLYKAMELLTSTNEPMEQIALAVGIEDASYFARFFKKNCGITPSEYRNTFKADRS